MTKNLFTLYTLLSMVVVGPFILIRKLYDYIVGLFEKKEKNNDYRPFDHL